MDTTSILQSLWKAFCLISGILMTISLSTYILPCLYFSIIARPQNVRKKYGEWALITGASSGIGKSLSEKLLQQGVNIILVALDDDMLAATYKELKQLYGSGCEIRCVGADLTKNSDKYMGDIIKASSDVDVSMVFSNAGYITMDYFNKRSIESHVGLLQCNSIAGLRIVYHFYNQMISKQIKGCICFTSSAVSYLVSYSSHMNI